MADLILHANLPRTKNEIRSFIAFIEEKISHLPQEKGTLAHSWSHDCYVRRLELPAHHYFIGKIHRFKVVNFITKGRLSVMSPDMDGVVELKAGDFFISQPGAKRLVYTHEDSEWINVHGTASRDIDWIEDHYIAKSYEEIE